MIPSASRSSSIDQPSTSRPRTSRPNSPRIAATVTIRSGCIPHPLIFGTSMPSAPIASSMCDDGTGTPARLSAMRSRAHCFRVWSWHVGQLPAKGVEARQMLFSRFALHDQPLLEQPATSGALHGLCSLSCDVAHALTRCCCALLMRALKSCMDSPMRASRPRRRPSSAVPSSVAHQRATGRARWRARIGRGRWCRGTYCQSAVRCPRAACCRLLMSLASSSTESLTPSRAHCSTRGSADVSLAPCFRSITAMSAARLATASRPFPLQTKPHSSRWSPEASTPLNAVYGGKGII